MEKNIKEKNNKTKGKERTKREGKVEYGTKQVYLLKGKERTKRIEKTDTGLSTDRERKTKGSHRRHVYTPFPEHPLRGAQRRSVYQSSGLYFYCLPVPLLFQGT